MLFALLICSGSLATSLPDRDSSAQDLAAYEVARENVGRSPAAHVELALWCEAHGLKAEQLKHLSLAVLMDPRNVSARGLMGLVAYHGHWQRPEVVARKVKDDEGLAITLAEYNARRGRLHETADSHWDLAVWCERNGLDAEAKAHFAVVTRLDPGREAAWKRLGCKKVGGRWVSEAQVAAEKEEAKAQEKADRHWKPLLTKWRGWLGEKARRAEAEEALAAVSDPRATPAVWSVFVAGSPAHHVQAVQVLGQIDASTASRALATLAISDSSAEVRRIATETLKRRDPREFAGQLVALLRKPIRYEVRPVNGPGSTGVLFVQGQRLNLRRNYSAPGLPAFRTAPNDFVLPDANGMPVIYDPLATGLQRIGTYSAPGIDAQMLANQQIGGLLSQGLGDAGRVLGDHIAANLNHDLLAQINISAGFSGQRMVLGRQQISFAEIPIGQMALVTQANAAQAQQQLASDIQALKSQNAAIAQGNDRVLAVLNPVTCQDLGPDPEAWSRWLTDLRGYAYQSKPAQETPTVTQDVPIAMAALPPITTEVFNGPLMAVPPAHSCFAAGTSVHTLTGPRTIESIRFGDRVLVQDTTTGGLAFEPVMAVYHNPPNQTFRVSLGDETVVVTAIHRFWKAGKGWTMARDLKPGDMLRTLDGTARVEAIEPVTVQPVFNLEVAGGHSFFVASRGVLVHDNSLVEPVTRPFDAVKDLAAMTSAH